MSYLSVIKNKCTGCTLCVGACPFGALEMQENKAVVLEHCTACGICLDSCNFQALEMSETKNRGETPISDEYRGVWIFAQQKQDRPLGVAYELLGVGRKLADDLQCSLSAVILGGTDVMEGSRSLIAYGADTVYAVSHPSLTTYNDDSYADILTRLIRTYKPEIVLMGATAYGRSLAPRVSSRLETGLTADCTGLEIDPEKRILMQTRPAFGGNLMATIICPTHRPQMASVRPKVMKPLNPDWSRKGQIVTPDVEIPSQTRTIVRKEVSDLCDLVSLADADVIVAGGRGLGDPKHFALLKELAQIFKGAVGASRAAVDSGWIAYSHQVGQTGTTVGPRIYFAIGISGAVQHLVGMSSADIIIAINKNPDAPIFKVATYGIVGDFLEVVPMLIKEFKERLT